MIDPLSRLDLPDVEAMIDQQRYCVLHAPRQTGKTSCLLALMHYLNAQGRYHALYANIEAAQAMRGDTRRGALRTTGLPRPSAAGGSRAGTAA